MPPRLISEPHLPISALSWPMIKIGPSEYEVTVPAKELQDGLNSINYYYSPGHEDVGLKSTTETCNRAHHGAKVQWWYESQTTLGKSNSVWEVAKQQNRCTWDQQIQDSKGRARAVSTCGPAMRGIDGIWMRERDSPSLNSAAGSSESKGVESRLISINRALDGWGACVVMTGGIRVAGSKRQRRRCGHGR